MYLDGSLAPGPRRSSRCFLRWSVGSAFRGVSCRGADLIALDDETPLMRPRTRGDCIGGSRPCPWIACRYSLARIETMARGGVRVGSSTLAYDADESEFDVAIDLELERLE